jgi:hypothetical protein
MRREILFYLAEPPMFCTPNGTIAVSNRASIQDVETYVAKVKKEMLAEGVRQRLEDQSEDQT